MISQRYKYGRLKSLLRWLRLFFSYLLFGFMIICVINYQTCIYLIHQAHGQLSILLNTQTIHNYVKNHKLNQLEKSNILLIEKVKKFSIDSLGYLPTNNFTKIYDQKKSPTLFVITASKPYELKAYEWRFPVVGNVSYKGFFEKEIAMREYNHLVAAGYDVDLRSVSAWSTLGWFNDPLLSTMLNRNKASLCNLLFHELFHATYYKSNAVNFNENIASFVAHHATVQFLKNDSLALKNYLSNYTDNKIYNQYIIKKANFLRTYYPLIINKPNKLVLKFKAIFQIADSINLLPTSNHQKFLRVKETILESKNAYFIDFEQYDSMQDSLERIFNKIYKGNLKKLVQDLKQDKTIINFDK